MQQINDCCNSIPLEYAYRKEYIEFDRLEAVYVDKSIYKEN